MVAEPRFRFEALTRQDLPLLFDWRNRPHVAQWWGGAVSMAEVRARYLPRIGSGTVRPYLAWLGDAPEGFIQSYVAMEQADWPEENDPGVVGIDQFLASAENLGKGLGTEMVRQFVQLLFLRDPTVTRVQTDPSPDNPRAIRCYEKAGFRRREVVETPDGAALLMTVER